MEYTSIFNNSDLNSLEREMELEFSRYAELNTTCFIVSEDFYWAHKLWDSSLYNLSKFKDKKTYLAIYSEEEINIVYTTCSDNLNKINSLQHIYAEDTLLGNGICCFVEGQGRDMLEDSCNCCAFYGPICVPHLRIVDYMDNTITPIGKHLLLINELDITNLKLSIDNNFIKNLNYNKNLTKAELLKLYGLEYNHCYTKMLMDCNVDILKLDYTKFIDIIPSMLKKLYCD